MDFKNIIKSNGRKFDRLRPVRSLLDGDSRVKKPYFSIFLLINDLISLTKRQILFRKWNYVADHLPASEKKKNLTASSIPFITYSRVFG